MPKNGPCDCYTTIYSVVIKLLTHALFHNFTWLQPIIFIRDKSTDYFPN